MGYTVIDLGSDPIPARLKLTGSDSAKSLSDAGDAILASGQDGYFLRLFSGAIVDLPAQIGYSVAVAAGTNGDQLLINQAPNVYAAVVFSIPTGMVSPIVLPDPNYLFAAHSINSKGDIVGEAWNLQNGYYFTAGYVLNWLDRDFISVEPKKPDGEYLNLTLAITDINDIGLAVGTQSYIQNVYGLPNKNEIVWYDGANLTGIPLLGSSGPRIRVCRINNRKHVAAEVGLDVLLYDVANQAVLTTFPNAKLHGISI